MWKNDPPFEFERIDIDQSVGRIGVSDYRSAPATPPVNLGVSFNFTAISPQPFSDWLILLFLGVFRLFTDLITNANRLPTQTVTPVTVGSTSILLSQTIKRERDTSLVAEKPFNGE